MTLRSNLEAAIRKLAQAGAGSPRLNAELLLMFTLGCDRAYLYAHPERELTENESRRYDNSLAQRAQGIPTQYITGHQEFWGLDLVVSPAVLIPRPETEHAVEAALEIARAMPNEGGGRTPAPLRIVDVGTGSGCIALALAKELPRAIIIAIDVSSEALDIARTNAARHQLESRVEFREGDLLRTFEPGRLDLVVSNPPYVGESEADQVQLEVRKFEPRRAVFAGQSGLEVIARLLPQAYDALRPGGALVMEISGSIADGLRPLLAAWQNLQIRNDLQGIPRVITATRP